MHTAGVLTQGKPVPDLQLFIPAAQALGFNAGTAVGTPVAAFAGILPPGGTNAAVIDSIAIVASTTTNIKFDLSQIFIRTGVFATPDSTQQQFGTAAGQPGPSAVAGTSDPSGFGYGEVDVIDTNAATLTITAGNNEFAPVKNVLLPALQGPITNKTVTSGNIVKTTKLNTKGIRIKWIDVIYRVNGVALTTLGVILYKYLFTSGHDALIGWNGGWATVSLTGAALAINTTANKLHRERATIVDNFGNPTTQFITDDGSMLNLVIDFVTPSGSTANLVGVILGCDYNFN